MKKKIIIALLSVALFSCTKSVEENKTDRNTKHFIQVVAVDYDGTETMSPIILVK
jgi:hypothetical protein